MKLTDKMALWAVILIIVTMPVSGQYVLMGLELGFREIFRYGAWVTLVAAVYMIGYIFAKMYQSREVINIPPKPKTSKKIPVTIQ